MSHLIAISVGPVQEFIAAARRTRDLWFGSYLLSEISKAVAQSVKDQDGKLVFPHPDTDLDFGDDKVNVANVILAVLPSEKPRCVAAQAKRAAQDRWLKFVKDAWDTAHGVIRKDIWDEQVDDVIEFYAAWVSHTDPDSYQQDRSKLMRLLAGRKNCRDFPPARGRAGLPKSSLDGQRESVLKDPARERWPERFRARLRIREGEQLDVVGLVKRVAEGTRPYPSVSRVAADPWVRGNTDNPAFKDLKTTCEELPRNVLHRLDKEVFPQFRDFPYEGTAAYKSRHHEWEEEIDEEDRLSIDDIQDALKDLPEPSPYLAVLVADGDKMGAAISNLPTAEANRAFSWALAGFAGEARNIVNDHNGVLVYAGGDDVLAFLPVDKCLKCARDLRNKFIALLDESMARIFEKEPEKKPPTPTLSVGIAIGHFMENLEDLLGYGRAAEKAAKKVVDATDPSKSKDALAIHMHKRGGSPVQIASRWESDPQERLALYAELMQKGAVPGKLPYDLQELIEIYEADGWKDQDRISAMQKDALRIIADKQPRAGKAYMKQVRESVARLSSFKDLKRFCEELLVARLLAEDFDQAGRTPTPLKSDREEVPA